MEFTIEQLKDIVGSCGGVVELVEKHIEMLKDKPINNLTELIDYPFKNDYGFVISREEAPSLRKFFDDTYWEKYETYTLDYVLEMLVDKVYDEHKDDEDFNEDLTQEELVDKYFPEIAKELIELRFGSMEMDW